MALLAPGIIETILEGRQPRSLTIASLKRACPLPMSWEEQRETFLRGARKWGENPKPRLG